MGGNDLSASWVSWSPARWRRQILSPLPTHLSFAYLPPCPTENYPLPQRQSQRKLEAMSGQRKGGIWAPLVQFPLEPDCVPTVPCSLTPVMGSSCCPITHRQAHLSEYTSPDWPQICCLVNSTHSSIPRHCSLFYLSIPSLPPDLWQPQILFFKLSSFTC